MRHAQVEVGVQVEDEDALRGRQRLRDAPEGAPGHLVPAAQYQGQAALRPWPPPRALAQRRLGRFQRALRAFDVAHVPSAGSPSTGRLASALRAASGPSAAPTRRRCGAHAFVHGKADQATPPWLVDVKGCTRWCRRSVGPGSSASVRPCQARMWSWWTPSADHAGSLRPCFLAWRWPARSPRRHGASRPSRSR